MYSHDPQQIPWLAKSRNAVWSFVIFISVNDHCLRPEKKRFGGHTLSLFPYFPVGGKQENAAASTRHCVPKVPIMSSSNIMYNTMWQGKWVTWVCLPYGNSLLLETNTHFNIHIKSHVQSLCYQDPGRQHKRNYSFHSYHRSLILMLRLALSRVIYLMKICNKFLLNLHQPAGALLGFSIYL